MTVRVPVSTISLIGYRGSGKSSVGRLLADQLGWPVFDSDAAIEESEGRSIPEIFADAGEVGFRKCERDTIVRLLTESPAPRVLSLGGGAILNAETRADLSAAGPVFYLKATVETLAGRIAGDEANGHARPSLTGHSAVDEIAAVLAVRSDIYEATATDIIETDRLTPSEVADHIRKALATTIDEVSAS